MRSCTKIKANQDFIPISLLTSCGSSKCRAQVDCVIWRMLLTCGNMAAPEERARRMAMPPVQPIFSTSFYPIPIANSAAAPSQPVSWPLLLYTMRASSPMRWARQGNLAKDKKAAPAVSLLPHSPFLAHITSTVRCCIPHPTRRYPIPSIQSTIAPRC